MALSSVAVSSLVLILSFLMANRINSEKDEIEPEPDTVVQSSVEHTESVEPAADLQIRELSEADKGLRVDETEEIIIEIKRDSPESETITADPVIDKIDDQAFIWFLEYGGHNYYYSTSPLSWSGSERFCRERGGYLAALTSLKEHQAVVLALMKNAAPANFWIGLNRWANPKVWAWSNGEPYVFSWWCQGEPSNTEGLEDCAEIWVMLPTPVQPWKWNDRREGTPNLFIMERDSSL